MGRFSCKIKNKNIILPIHFIASTIFMDGVVLMMKLQLTVLIIDDPATKKKLK